MKHFIRLNFCLAVLLSTGGAMAQAADAQTDESASETTSSPVAHVYVGTGNQIVAFSAAANGRLTPVPGSPFNNSLSPMGASGRYLFGFETNSVIIDSFSMAANGALKKAATTNTQNFNLLNCSPLVSWNGQGLKIDHSGEDLYNAAVPGDFPCDSAFQSFRIDERTERDRVALLLVP